MLFKTKLFRNVNKIFYTFKKRILIVQNSFSLALFSLFLGFLCGNLFGTFLDTLRIYFFWNGLVAFIILLFIEAINFLVYRIPLTEKININLSVSNVQNFSYLLGQNIKPFFNLHFLYALLNPFLERGKYKAKNLRNNRPTSKVNALITPDKSFDKSSRLNPLQVAELTPSGLRLEDLSENLYGYPKGVSSATCKGYKREYEELDFLSHKNKKIIFTIYIERSLNAFKIGLLFGFFIDIFKVGS